MDLPSTRPSHSIVSAAKAICIVGAGPVGLAALKAVLDSPQYKAGYWKPTAFESRDDIGGVWYILPLIMVPDHSP